MLKFLLPFTESVQQVTVPAGHIIMQVQREKYTTHLNKNRWLVTHNLLN